MESVLRQCKNTLALRKRWWRKHSAMGRMRKGRESLSVANLLVLSLWNTFVDCVEYLAALGKVSRNHYMEGHAEIRGF